MQNFKRVLLDDYASVTQKIIEGLTAENKPFVCWLIGDMGAGKTTIARKLLYGLGLSESTQVTSPTFTYMNEYRIGDQWYAHLDLYRSPVHLSIDDLGVSDAREYQGIFIEWPSAASGQNSSISPTHILEITNVSPLERDIALKKHLG